MATIVLQAAGAFLGGFLGPVSMAIGSAAGAMAGYAIDRTLLQGTQRVEGPRLSSQRLFSAEEGAALPRVYGTARLSGNVIWATRFEERRRTTRQGGKGGGGGQRVTTYHYYANAAFALCEGEIAGVRRVWADGREVDRTRIDIRIHRGTENQAPDPLIEAVQGAGNAPAYRGVAYAVVERFALDDYGNRLPQFHFEVIRPVGDLNGSVRSVALIPGSTEYGLATELVTATPVPGERVPLNRHTLAAPTDIAASLDELQALCPNLEEICLVVAWFGSDLRAGHCLIRPAVAQASLPSVSRQWRASGLQRGQAPVVSSVDGKAAYGGTPSDRSVMQAITHIKARGLRVTLHPFIMMDVPADNVLPDPHGGEQQAAYPWRGRITCHPAPGQPGTADKTAEARQQVEALVGSAAPGSFQQSGDTISFSGSSGDWGFRRFVLHHAHLAAAADGVDAFMIGSELPGLTRLRDETGAFPFVEAMTALAGDVRAVLGGQTAITYGADWSEYYGYQPGDGTGDVFFNLDPFWAHEDVTAVSIHNYMPLSDWRDGDHDGGNPDGLLDPYDPDGLAAGIASGEGFDWYYASDEDRVARVRTPITDGAHDKPWVFRPKDLLSWWENEHFDRPGGVEAAEPTAWQPRSKPIWFTELGCPAVDKGPNQPNVFPDPKSSESAAPHFSGKGRSDIAQRRFLAAHFDRWDDARPAFAEGNNPVSPLYAGRMVDAGRISVWAWDARPFPAFPSRADIWSDGANWQFGHWLSGRLSSVGLGDLINAVLADHGLPAADTRGVAGTLAGLVTDDPTTARAVLAPLMDLFGLTAFETGQGLFLTAEGRGVAAEIGRAELVVPERGAVLGRARLPEHELPGEVEIGFRDPFQDHQPAIARAAREESAGGTSMLALPAMMEPGQAEALARDWLARQWDGRDTVSFALSPGERALAPGSVFGFTGDDGPRFMVTRVDDGLARSVEARRVRRTAPAPWRPAGMAAATPAATIAALPHVVFLDLPMAPGAGAAPEARFRVAARARPWRSHLVLASPEASGFAGRGLIVAPAAMGRLASPLGPGIEGRVDRGGAILVDLFEGELASVSMAQWLNGANAAAIRAADGGLEIVQFAGAEEVAASQWVLSGLLRGQLGTSDAMAAGAGEGADFVLLDEAVVAAGLAPSEVGLLLNWKVVPAGEDPSDAAFEATPLAGGIRALTPLSPVHMRLTRDQVGNADIAWVRRGRVDADSWDASEIPLGEAIEAYTVEIGPAGGPVARFVETASPHFHYGLAQIEADFGSLPAEIEVAVRQVSQAAGPGTPARRVFALQSLT